MSEKLKTKFLYVGLSSRKYTYVCALLFCADFFKAKMPETRLLFAQSKETQSSASPFHLDLIVVITF